MKRLRPRLSHLSLGQQLNLVVAFASLSSLVLACSAFISYEVVRFKDDLLADTLSLTRVVGQSSLAAVAFRDPKASLEVLQALQHDPRVLAARVSDVDGVVLAEYRRARADGLGPVRNGPDGSSFEGNRLVALATLRLGAAPIGRIEVAASLEELPSRLWRYVALGAIVLLLSGGAAFALSRPVKGAIVGPILAFVDALRAVSGRGDYGVRVERVGSTELGLLADTFNGMLEQVQERDAALLTARDELSRKVTDLQHEAAEREAAQHRQGELQGILEIAVHEWQSTFDAIPTPILVVLRDGMVERLNEAARQLSGRAFQACIGWSVGELGSGEPWRAMLRQIRSDEASVTRVPDEASGAIWDVACSRFSQGVPEERRILVAQEVTRTVELEASLRESARLSGMGALLGGVAHEVRNPLFALSATLDAFEARFAERTEYRPHVETLRGQLDRINQLMSELMDYGRPSTPSQAPDSLAEVIETARGQCEALARLARVTLSVRVPDTLPEMPMDVRRIAAVFRNLIENAVQHSQPGQTVWVDAHLVKLRGGAFVECTVRDEGPGIRGQDPEQLFEPFYTQRRGGTGLGLALAKRVVHEHRGTIGAANGSPRGAVFTVRLPLEATRRRGGQEAAPV